jgi:RNA polymerase sigma-70 factor (ECF subfamily)
MPEMELRAQFEAALSVEVYNSAWRYAWRLAAAGRGGCHQDAEDLLQEALCHAWRQFGQLRDRNQFRAWLLSIVRTRYLNRLRTARRRPQVDGEPAPDIASSGVEHDVLQLDAQVAMALLKEEDRELLQLFYLENLSLEEVGVALGMSARVVRQRLYRARQNMRKVIERMRQAESAHSQPGTSPRRSIL